MMCVWLPAIRAGTGADVFTERLAVALRATFRPTSPGSRPGTNCRQN